MQNNQYDPEYNRNLITAFLIISVLMGVWYYFYEIPHKKALFDQQQKQIAEQQIKDKQVAIQEQLNQPMAMQQILNTPAKTVAIKTREEVVAGSQRVKIETPKLHGSINLTGLRLDDIKLAKYKETMLPDSKDVILLSPPDTLEPTFIEFGWYPVDKSLKMPDATSQWQQTGGDVLSVDKPVSFAWDNGAGLKFLTTISVDENYMFSIEEKVENNGQQAVAIYPYGLINKAEPATTTESTRKGTIHTGPVAMVDKTFNQMSYKNLREGNKEYPNATGWIGITDQYWAKVLVPEDNETYKASFKYASEGDTEKFQVDYLGAQKNINPGQTATYNSKIFTGAKELKVLDSYRDNQHLLLFDRLIDFGWLYFLSKPLMGVLLYIYGFIGNIGLSILALTLCVKLVLFPLARKSYLSMGRLKDLQPKMKALKEQYGKDKMELNRKTMELYSKEKINPASGCLPLILQMPIFIALYKVFSVSIEMRHTPFYGWIHDLSAPDPTSVVNLFGAVPIALPASLIILGAWPVLWMLTMYAQQKISPPMADPSQAKMMRAVPLVLAITFSKALPAALIIYYVFNNLLTLCQQLYFLKFHSVTPSGTAKL